MNGYYRTALNTAHGIRTTHVLSIGRSNQAGNHAAQPAAAHTSAAAAAQQPSQEPVQKQQQQQQQPPPDPGLEAFKALIAEKRFTCTQCGKCCTGDGEVWMSDAEAVNIAAYLSLPLERFMALHTRTYSKVAGYKMLRSNMDSETRDCTFLRPDNTCAIHPVRPLQCSTYPWWPDLMADKDWTWERENICEGFDHPDAPPTDLDDAARQLKLATIQEYKKRLAYKPSKKQQKTAAAVVEGAGSNSSGSSSSAGGSSSSAGGSSSSAGGGSSTTGSNTSAGPTKAASGSSKFSSSGSGRRKRPAGSSSSSTAAEQQQ